MGTTLLSFQGRQNYSQNPPVVDRNKITVYENSTNTSLGLATPTDADGDPLTIRVARVPRLGEVTKADGTVVKRNDILTSEELVGLEYDAPANYNGKGYPGSFFYFVNDGSFDILGSTRITLKPSPEHYKPREVIVTLEDPSNETFSNSIQSLRDELDIEVVSTIEAFDREVWKLPSSTTVKEFIEEYDSRPEIDIQPNYKNRLSRLDHPNDPDYNNIPDSVVPPGRGVGRLWALNNKGQTGGKDGADINAPKAWGYETPELITPVDDNGSPKVRVAVIDTGVDVDHPDLINNLDLSAARNFVDGYNNTDNISKEVEDLDGHGTHVAGIIGAIGNNNEGVVGVSWNVEIVPIKAFDFDENDVPIGFDSDIIEAIDYAINDAQVDIINASWGKPVGTPYSKELKEAISNVNHPSGRVPPLFVAAAGNESNDNDNANLEMRTYPASYDLNNIISVAATDHNDQLSPFSNYGRKSVDLAAPGGSNLPDNNNNPHDSSDIYSTVPVGTGIDGGNYGYSAGTSAAAAYVSGAAALMLGTRRARRQTYPVGSPMYNALDDLSAIELKDKLLEVTTPNTPYMPGNWPTATGGRLNLYEGIRRQGIGWGDVHFVTFDGRKYDLQSFGDFIMAETARKDDDWVVQTRQEPVVNNRSVSINTAFATLVDGQRVVFNVKFPNNRLQIDGVDFPLASGETKSIGNSKIERNNNKYTITYAGNDGIIDIDDTTLTAFDGNNHINIYISDSARMQGLLGNNDGNPNNDFALRDGTQLPNNLTVRQIHQQYGESWRVKEGESLFKNPATVIDLPEKFISLDDFPQDEVAAAKAKVKKAGITDENRVNAVAFDLLATEDESFLSSAVEMFNSLDGNSAPTDIKLDNNTIDENVTPGATVGKLSTTDPDNEDSFTYALVEGVGDRDNAGFNVDGDQLKINGSPDYETQSSYSIRVKTTDGKGASYEEQLTINVNDLDDKAPTAATFTPTDNATDIAIGTSLVINFDENIQAGTGNIIIKQFSDNSVVETINVTSSLVSISNNTLTINPTADLAERTKYYVEVEADAIQDTSGNNYLGIKNNSTWNFTTINNSPVQFDFNGDGVADILWRKKIDSPANAENQIWFMNDDGTVNNSAPLKSNYSTWGVAGVGDFNADQVPDILWRNKYKRNEIWFMNDDGTFNSRTRLKRRGSSWSLGGVADFNADQATDILWRNKYGYNEIWFMNDEGALNHRARSLGPDSSWDVAGVGDFNADQVADILWRDQNENNMIWMMNDDGTVNNSARPDSLNSSWDVVGVANFNADQVADILWRDEKGSSQIWLMNDQGKVQNSISLGSYDSPWNVKGMPDLNGDGVADILWRNENNGANHIWLMNDDGTRNQIVDPGSLDSTWDIVGM